MHEIFKSKFQRRLLPQRNSTILQAACTRLVLESALPTPPAKEDSRFWNHIAHTQIECHYTTGHPTYMIVTTTVQYQRNYKVDGEKKGKKYEQDFNQDCLLCFACVFSCPLCGFWGDL